MAGYKEINVKVKLFKYDDLNQEAKNRAFEEYKESLWNQGQEYETDEGEIKTDYSEPDKETVEDTIRINEHWFFESGEMADTTTYTGKHEKPGITELKLFDKVYQL